MDVDGRQSDKRVMFSYVPSGATLYGTGIDVTIPKASSIVKTTYTVEAVQNNSKILTSLDNALSVEIDSVGSNWTGATSNVHLIMKNKTKNKLYGFATVLLYSNGNLAACRDIFVNLEKKGEEYADVYFIYDTDFVVDSVKVKPGFNPFYK